MRCWFEYAPVAQNTADLPSCEAFARMREVIDAASDPEWILYFWKAVLPVFLRHGVRLWLRYRAGRARAMVLAGRSTAEGTFRLMPLSVRSPRRSSPRGLRTAALAAVGHFMFRGFHPSTQGVF